MTVHIEGMGLLGSLLALSLDARDVPFTWHDIDSPHVAWRASTGMVYPAGDARSQAGLDGWRRWRDQALLPADAVEEVRYAYHHRHPPHDGTYRPEYDLGWCRVAPVSAPGGAFAVNAPTIVQHARARFADTRTDRPAAGATLVRAHGFTDRLGKVMWGWTVPVRLGIPTDLSSACHPMRPALYSRRHRFQIVYAYPIPGRPDWWWSGSTLVGQTTPRALDPEKHYARWLEAWTINFPDVPVLARETALQGWRPRPSVEPDDDSLVTVNGRTLTLPPLWHSGVRWSPLVIAQTLTRLGVA